MSAGVDAGRSAISKLDDVSQKHQAEVVVDLGADRLVKWIGFYVLTALAVILKLVDVIGGSGLNCFPANSNGTANGDFIKYSSSYCWETLHPVVNNGSCAKYDLPSLNFIQNPYALKMLVLSLPYVILLQGLVFASLWAAWQLRFGARLQGHLRFLKLLLEDIFNKVKTISKGHYPAQPYDKPSKYFDGLRDYHSDEEKNKTPNRKMKRKSEVKQIKKGQSLGKNNQSTPEGHSNAAQSTSSGVPTGTVNESSSSEIGPLLDSGDKASGKKQPQQSDKVSSSSNKSNNNNASQRTTDSSAQEKGSSRDDVEYAKLNFLNKFIVGGMRDQHLFSMLCSENFSSLHHLPYILSVFKLSGDWGSPPGEDEEDRVYLDEGILKIWCHTKNMTGVRLVSWYFWKHIVTALAALTMLAIMLFLYFLYLHEGYLASETFRCELPFEDVCMLCTIQRKTEIFVILFIDMALTSIVMTISVTTWFVVRSSKNRVTCCFFRQISDISNIALATANLMIKDAKST